MFTILVDNTLRSSRFTLGLKDSVTAASAVLVIVLYGDIFPYIQELTFNIIFDKTIRFSWLSSDIQRFGYSSTDSAVLVLVFSASIFFVTVGLDLSRNLRACCCHSWFFSRIHSHPSMKVILPSDCCCAPSSTRCWTVGEDCVELNSKRLPGKSIVMGKNIKANRTYDQFFGGKDG